jgi:hypothetical protein
MPRTSTLVVGAAAVAVLAVALFWDRSPNAPPTPKDPPKSDAGAQKPGPAPAVGKPVPRDLPPTDPKADRTGWVAYPDGSSYPPLNGVTTAPKLIWHRLVPFTRVVRIERDASGRDWYVHENGARSTTYVDARGQVMSDIEMPKATQPVVDEPPPGNGK